MGYQTPIDSVVNCAGVRKSVPSTPTFRYAVNLAVWLLHTSNRATDRAGLCALPSYEAAEAAFPQPTWVEEPTFLCNHYEVLFWFRNDTGTTQPDDSLIQEVGGLPYNDVDSKLQNGEPGCYAA